MTMTKIDFERLAAAFRENLDTLAAAGDTGGVLALTRGAEAVAGVCAASNDRFDRARFLAACGIGDANSPMCDCGESGSDSESVLDHIVETDCCGTRWECETVIILDGAGEPDVRVCRTGFGCAVTR